LGGFEEAFEERPELAGAEEILRVPLNAEAEARVGSSIASITPSGAVARHRKPGATILHRLMVTAVHFARVRVAQSARASEFDSSESFSSQIRARASTTGSAARQAVRQRARAADGMSCTSVPPQATFSTWTPRQIAKIGTPRSRAAFTSRSRTRRGQARPRDRGVRLLAVDRRRDVVAAGEHQPVEPDSAASTPWRIEMRGSPPTCRIDCR
jgi:hypothetical protein